MSYHLDEMPPNDINEIVSWSRMFYNKVEHAFKDVSELEDRVKKLEIQIEEIKNGKNT
jgi:hypothetical protein